MRWTHGKSWRLLHHRTQSQVHESSGSIGHRSKLSKSMLDLDIYLPYILSYSPNHCNVEFSTSNCRVHDYEHGFP